MKNIKRAIRNSRKTSEWHLSKYKKGVYEIEEIDEITEEVSKVFDEMKETYGLNTDEIEKPEKTRESNGET